MLLTAFLIGIAGSLHCAGMCSPLVMAVSGLSRHATIRRLLYNAGRILTYGMLGAVVGVFGAIAGFTDYQNLLAAMLGVLLILFGLSGVSAIHIPLITGLLQRFATWLKRLFASQVKAGTWLSLLLMGGINGLLPCGLTYFALTYCITLPSASQGFLFMLAFGAGTLPVMVGLPIVLKSITSMLPWKLHRISSIVMIGLGALLLVRSAYFIQQEPMATSAQASEVVCP